MRSEFRRRIRLTKQDDHIIAELEDDFHRFSVCLRHNDHELTEISSQTIRYPWSICPEANKALNELVATPLTSSPLATLLRANRQNHCMHLLDLAGLAISHSQRRESLRTYDCTVPDRANGATAPHLTVNNRNVLAWQVTGNRITSPKPYEDVNLKSFAPWAEHTLDRETLEYGLILRRAVLVSQGRLIDLDSIPRLADFPGAPACYSYQSENLSRVQRMAGSSRDFTHSSADLLSELE